MNELEKRIVDSTKDGTFLDVLYEEYRKHIGDDDELIRTLVGLHNQEKINIISEFGLLRNEVSNSNFFIIRNIFRNLLPLLNVPVEEVKSCVKQLTIEAGSDMASHDLILPFIEFCSADIERVESLLEQELKVTDDDFDHISTALISGYKINKKTYFNKAVQLLNHRNPIIVQRVIFALSRFNYNEEPELAATVVKEIITCTKSIEDEQILSTAINTLITLLSDYEELELDIIEFIEHNIGNNSPEFIFRIAQQLNYRHDSLSEGIQQLLFNFFKNLDTKYIGVIEQIDWYIYKKISSSNALDISKLLEHLIDNNHSFQIDILSHSLQKIQTQEFGEMLSVIFTRWLLKREMIYCVSAVKLVKTSTSDQIKIGFDTGQVKVEDLMYLVNKAISWFILQPLTSLNFILSILSMCSDSKIKLIEKNTFNYIALNYSSQTKYFLQEHLNSSDKNTMNFSKNITQQLEDFLQNFSNFHKIKELRPSTKQRSEYANHQQKLFDEASSEPREELSFSSLFTKRVTLYGNKFIHKRQGSNGEMVRQVMPFSKMSHSIDFPSLANLTPHTLQYFLSKFQFEDLINETNS
ncbi:hypothetical protein ACQKCF_10560 [Psychrobacter proteolyticus]|uniref:hypothetical protein n=1 Tax=Psychrobacter proteolyticus TaxID=147825 RepID=UPI003CFEF540